MCNASTSDPMIVWKRAVLAICRTHFTVVTIAVKSSGWSMIERLGGTAEL